MTDRFFDKRVFVTGAGSGIGYEIAKQFAEQGAIVGVNSLDESETLTAVKEIGSIVPGAKIDPRPCDIADITAIQSHIASFAAEHDGLDIFIANAGVTIFSPFLDVQYSDLEYLIRVNLLGTFCSVQEAARQMVARKTRGRIILMSSVCGLQSHLNTSAYGATKAAIRHLATSLAEELGIHGITVNAIAPGATITQRTLNDPEYAEGWCEVSPNRKVGTVSDVTYATLFLCDDQAAHITGQVITVDGGWTKTSPLPAYLKQRISEDASDKRRCDLPVATEEAKGHESVRGPKWNARLPGNKE